MKVRLVFKGWINAATGMPAQGTAKDNDLTNGSFHSGTTFDAMIDVSADDLLDLEVACRDGFEPTFYATRASVMADGSAVLARTYLNEHRKQKP